MSGAADGPAPGRPDAILSAFDAEATALGVRLRELSADECSRPTNCPPWTVAALVGHVITGVDRLPGMLAAPAPEVAGISAAQYYRRDHRFSADVDADRIAVAVDLAGGLGAGRELAAEFDQSWREASRCGAQQPADRVVRTRHGDAMLLPDFLVTRVVELGVHGLDLAAALGRPAWLTPQAADVLVTLLLGENGRALLHQVGWDQVLFLRKATGREPVTPGERAILDRHGIRWLALGG